MRNAPWSAIAARALGIGTAGDFGRYFRLVRRPGTRVAELAEAGELIPVEVTGWGRPAYLHRDAVIPRRIAAQALVSPFDPLLWERDRAERLFGFHYRIEITYGPKIASTAITCCRFCWATNLSPGSISRPTGKRARSMFSPPIWRRPRI